VARDAALRSLRDLRVRAALSVGIHEVTGSVPSAPPTAPMTKPA
jgi:hypothetical protein